MEVVLEESVVVVSMALLLRLMESAVVTLMESMKVVSMALVLRLM